MQLCLKYYWCLLWRLWVWATSLQVHRLVAAFRLWGCVLLASQPQRCNAGIAVLQHRSSTDLPLRLEPSHNGEQGKSRSRCLALCARDQQLFVAELGHWSLRASLRGAWLKYSRPWQDTDGC